jgi:Uma2 family endonuclease
MGEQEVATARAETVWRDVVVTLPEDTLRRWLSEALLTPRYRVMDRLSYEEFLDWADEDTLAEWVDGEVVMYSPASDRHQDLARFLTSVLSIYAETHDLGVVRPAPFQMKLEHSGREPDLLFIAKEHLDRLQETYLEGPADLAVEIISPESIGRDRGEKFYEYEAGNVPEYWLIDPQKARAEFYQLRDGQYQQVPPDAESVYRSEVLPGFWLQVEWLWQDTLPKTLDVLRKLDVV